VDVPEEANAESIIVRPRPAETRIVDSPDRPHKYASGLPALIAALGESGDRQETAIARLTILGRRVVPRLVSEFAATADRRRQIAVLRVLEGVADERAFEAARRAVTSGGDVAVAGVAVLRELLTTSTKAADVQALDLLLTIAEDASADRRLRAAARQALESGPPDVRGAVQSLGRPESAEGALWQDAIAGQLPDDPRQLRQAVSTSAAGSSLPDLRRLVEAIGARERGETKTAAVNEWLAVRGAVHQALALRGSRVALYDLRETVAGAPGPMPASFLAALKMVGDESCVEPLAAAFARAADQDGWRRQIAQTVREIVKRERLTRKHAALRRAFGKAPALESLLQ
jgi:hypothetical protein